MSNTGYNREIVIKACDLYKQHKYNQAIELLETIKEEDISDLVVKNQYYYCKSASYEKLAQYDLAIKNAQKALRINDINPEYIGGPLSLLGTIYKKISEYDKAIDYYEQALKVTTNENNIADIESNIGSCLTKMEKYEEALIRFHKALRIKKKINSNLNKNMIELNICITQFYLTNYEESEKIFKKLLNLYKKEQKPQEQIFLYHSYAGMLFDKKEYYMAIKYLRMAFNLARIYKLKNEELFCLRAFGLIFRKGGKINYALKYYKKAIEIEENIGKNNISEEYLKMYFYQNKSDLYQSVVEINYKLNKYEDAFIYSQKSKAKTFREIYNLKNLEVLTINKIQRILNTFDKNIIIIDYFMDINNLYIFSIDKKNFECKKIEVSLDILTRIYKYYNEEIIHAETREDADIGELWNTELAKYLIKPIVNNIKNQDIIYFVPQGIISYFPLHSLELDNIRIINKCAVGYLNTVSLLSLWQDTKIESKKTNENIIFGVGDGVIEEARNIHKNILGKLYTENEVTKVNVINNITDKNIVYFSCHGYYNHDMPLKSGIELYDDIFTVEDINQLKINTDMIILSACESGLGTFNFSNEIIGLAQAFLQAGVKTVIVTLWRVNIESTNLLMSDFTKELKNNNRIEALKIAQNNIMNNPKFQHPYYNAGFILLGNWQ